LAIAPPVNPELPRRGLEVAAAEITAAEITAAEVTAAEPSLLSKSPPPFWSRPGSAPIPGSPPAAVAAESTAQHLAHEQAPEEATAHPGERREVAAVVVRIGRRGGPPRAALAIDVHRPCVRLASVGDVCGAGGAHRDRA
jgi:hypothetical protein